MIIGEAAIRITDKYAKEFILSVFDTDNDGFVTPSEANIERQLYWDKYINSDKINIIDLREFNAIEGAANTLTHIKEYYMGYSKTETLYQMFYQNRTLEVFCIGANVMKISSRTCRECINLKKVILNDKIQQFYGDPFRGCISLVEISDIPDTCNEIGGDCFYGCSSLKSITIGSGIKQILYGAFRDCSAMESFVIKAVTPPTLGKDVFTGNFCTIYVPHEAVEVYKTATGWSDFASRIKPINKKL